MKKVVKQINILIIVTKEEIIPVPSMNNCKKLYVEKGESGVENKDLRDRFLTTLILSIIVFLANIGLAILGKRLFRTPGEFK